MSDTVTPQGRPRRWWLAFLLNAFLPPVGYAYLGKWRAVLVFLITLVVAAIALVEWSVAQPPGIYAFVQPALLDFGWGVTALGWGLAALLGAHAAWLASRSSPKQGSRLLHAAAYISPILLLIVVSVGLRAFWPHSAYTFSSSSMAPTFNEGDIVAVSGARALCGHARPVPGEVAVYKHDGSPVSYMHRVVAGPGQVVALKGGQLWVDGKPAVRRATGKAAAPWAGAPAATVVEETLPNGARYRTLDFGPDGELDTIPTTTVPADRWYFLGDSRDNAADSRVYGPVAARNICGVAVDIMYSKDKSRVGQKP